MAATTTTSAWALLSEAEQLREWRSFLSSLDAGGAGHHRHYAELMLRWDRGDVPELIEAERVEAYEVEARAEAAWAAEHVFDPEWAVLTFGDPPF
jgi:hypothetical protein